METFAIAGFNPNAYAFHFLKQHHKPSNYAKSPYF